MIYAYLAVIRLDDLGAAVFTKFILAQVRAGAGGGGGREGGGVCGDRGADAGAGCAKDERVSGFYLQRADAEQVAQGRMVRASHHFTTESLK